METKKDEATLNYVVVMIEFGGKTYTVGEVTRNVAVDEKNTAERLVVEMNRSYERFCPAKQDEETGDSAAALKPYQRLDQVVVAFSRAVIQLRGGKGDGPALAADLRKRYVQVYGEPRR